MRRVINVAAAAVACAVILALLGFGYGTIPALGPALDPGKGAWTSADAGRPVTGQTLSLPGLTGLVTVTFTAQGTASIVAQNQHDLWEALGYVQARFRLTEMDEERRLGEGRLAQLAGPQDLSSDEFELRLGLLRTAQLEWAQLPRNSQAAEALEAYAQGVNADLAQLRASGQWPATFTLAGVYPGPWTPVDSLVIQGELVQELDYTTTPLDYALLERSLGPARTMDWFPIIAKNAQTPYDPGPYKDLGVTAISPSAASTVTGNPVAGTAESDTWHSGRSDPSTEAEAAGAILAQPSLLRHIYPDSNAWAVTTGAKAQLAGDPHLPQTLPSVWYQAALAAPGYDATGVTVPGLPGVLIGHNEHIAWSLTNAQNQATMFYTEVTRGDLYFWDGAWRKMTVVHYDIPVRGAATVRLTVDITVHGPVLTQAGQTTSVDWMGNVPSPDLPAMLEVNEASDFQQFKAALANWYAPSQNFVYADTSGNIGVITAGYFPQVASPKCQPWLPMSGTGGCDVTGVIPYAAVPQVYDPPGRVVVAANQRQVTAAYPYYIGTSADFFDPGYRAATIYQDLAAGQSFSSIQNSLTDQLAARIVPKLLSVISDVSSERTVVNVLRGWNYTMAGDSAGASIWWTFWTDYLSDVFQPWWNRFKVPVGKDHTGLAIDVALQPSLDEDLEAWTLSDPANPAFGAGQTASSVMRSAFVSAARSLAASLGPDPSTWAWQRLHTRSFPAVSGAGGLGYGPRGSGGDAFTPDAADGDLTSSAGPSWRMIVSLSASGVSAIGIYPGGQDENPASPWYANQIPLWWDGQYLPVPAPGSVAAGPGTAQWRLYG
jgi:penicillin G amidase